MPEAPDEGRDHDGEDASGPEAVEEGDREHPADPLLGDGRQEPDEQHRRPRERRVEHVAVGHVGRRPRAEVRRDHVEGRLVPEEEGRERVAEDDAPEERLRLQPAPRERAAERDLARKPLAVDRLGRGHDEGDARARADGSENPEDDLLGEIARRAGSPCRSRRASAAGRSGPRAGRGRTRCRRRRRRAARARPCARSS